MRGDPIEVRMAEKIDTSDPNGCWLWTAARSPKGYARLGGKIASRLMFEIVNGYSPPAVRHKCDNPPCVNPAHLEGGTIADNNRDMWERGRQSHGINHNMGKLTDEEVEVIRRSNLRRSVVAEIFGVTADHVNAIRRNKTRVYKGAQR